MCATSEQAWQKVAWVKKVLQQKSTVAVCMCGNIDTLLQEPNSRTGETDEKLIQLVLFPDAAIEKIRQKLVQIKKAYPDNPGVTTCFQTMQKYLANVYRDPDQDKFRSIRLSNAAFQQHVAAFSGSLEVLEMCGFKVRRANSILTHVVLVLIVSQGFLIL